MEIVSQLDKDNFISSIVAGAVLVEFMGNTKTIKRTGLVTDIDITNDEIMVDLTCVNGMNNKQGLFVAHFSEGLKLLKCDQNSFHFLSPSGNFNIYRMNSKIRKTADNLF